MRAPFDDLDPYLADFAAMNGLVIDRDAGDGTQRRLRCDDRLIQLHVDADNDGKWYLSICVSEERDGSRQWKRRNLNGPVCLSRLHADLPVVLSAAWAELSSWLEDDAKSA